jgi:hypothetical protein
MSGETQHTGAAVTERRVEPRLRVDRYFSVEFIVEGMESIYQFRIWDLSAQGMCVLVRKDSELLSRLKVGQTWNMKYYIDDASKPADYLATQICHITRDDSGRFKDHYLVGLSILGNPPLT